MKPGTEADVFIVLGVPLSAKKSYPVTITEWPEGKRPSYQSITPEMRKQFEPHSTSVWKAVWLGTEWRLSTLVSADAEVPF